MASGNALPKSKGDGIIDLSSDADWEARLAEARERRAKVLKEAGKSEAISRPRVKPWEEAAAKPAKAEPKGDGEDVGVDFHDRMNRFKTLAGVKPPREKTKEEIERIDSLLDASDTAPIRTTQSVQDLAEKAPRHEPIPGPTPTSLILSEPRTRSLDPADVQGLKNAAETLFAEGDEAAVNARPKRSLWRFFGRSALVMVLGFIAGSTYVTFAGALGLPTF